MEVTTLTIRYNVNDSQFIFANTHKNQRRT
jgi:hypothetical protein